MAATVTYNKSSSVINISSTPSASPGDLITGFDGKRTRSSPWVIKGYMISGTNIAAGDEVTLTDGQGGVVLDVTFGTAKDTKSEMFHEDGKIRTQGLYIKTNSSGHANILIYT